MSMAGKANFGKWLLQKAVASMLKDLLQLKWLEGRRTKIAAVVIAGLTLALNLGWLDTQQYSAVVGFLTSVGLLSASVHKPTP